jgi:hypothetical protein
MPSRCCLAIERASLEAQRAEGRHADRPRRFRLVHGRAGASPAGAGEALIEVGKLGRDCSFSSLAKSRSRPPVLVLDCRAFGGKPAPRRVSRATLAFPPASPA